MTGSEPQKFAHYVPWIAASPGYCNQCVHQLENQADIMADELHFMMQMALGGIVFRVSQILSPFKNLVFNVLHVTFKKLFLLFLFP